MLMVLKPIIMCFIVIKWKSFTVKGILHNLFQIFLRKTCLLLSVGTFEPAGPHI